MPALSNIVIINGINAIITYCSLVILDNTAIIKLIITEKIISFPLIFSAIELVSFW